MRRSFLPVSAALLGLMGGAGLDLSIPPVVEIIPSSPHRGRVVKSFRVRRPGHNYPRQSARQAARYAAKSGLDNAAKTSRKPSTSAISGFRTRRRRGSTSARKVRVKPGKLWHDLAHY